jgi:hypothetical protein
VWSLRLLGKYIWRSELSTTGVRACFRILWAPPHLDFFSINVFIKTTRPHQFIFGVSTYFIYVILFKTNWIVLFITIVGYFSKVMSCILKSSINGLLRTLLVNYLWNKIYRWTQQQDIYKNLKETQICFKWSLYYVMCPSYNHDNLQVSNVSLISLLISFIHKTLSSFSHIVSCSKAPVWAYEKSCKGCDSLRIILLFAVFWTSFCSWYFQEKQNQSKI